MLIAKGNAALSASQNRQKTIAYIYIIFSLIALSGFGLFAIGPTITTISDLHKQLEENKEALKLLEQKNSALRSLSSQYIDIQPELNLIEKAIPKKASIATITRQLELLATKNGLTVQKLDTGLFEIYPARNPNTSIFSFTFSLGVSGGESNINKFIEEIISMERIISIEKLTTGGDSNSGRSASITGKAFFYKETL